MTRSGWTIEKKVDSVWTADGSIYRPNEDLDLEKLSTQQKITLANGSNAYVTPSTKYLDMPLRFVWYYDDGTTKTKIETYITNQNDLRITDHDSNQYVGRFVDCTSTQMIGEDPDQYNIVAQFEIMPSLE